MSNEAHDNEFNDDCQYCREDACSLCLDDLDEAVTYAHDAYCNTTHTAGPEPCPLPAVDEYGVCTYCRRRRATACACGMTFAEKVKTIALDEEALRIFNIGGKGRKRGKDHADNKRNA